MVVFVAEHMLYRRPALSEFNTMGTVAGMRRVLSLSSSFYHPDIDMKDFELLSQASACLVPTGDPHLPQKFHILASAHVTHPWRFPNYYPHETHAFVHVLSEEHIRCSVGLRNVRGVSTLTLPLKQQFTFLCCMFILVDLSAHRFVIDSCMLSFAGYWSPRV